MFWIGCISVLRASTGSAWGCSFRGTWRWKHPHPELVEGWGGRATVGTGCL